MKDFKEQLTEIYPKLKKHAIYVASGDDVDFEADELVNITIKKALENQHQFDGKHLLAWLKTIMKHEVVDDYRKGLKVEPQGEDGKQNKDKWRPKSRWKPYERAKREVNYENEKPDGITDNSKKIYLSDFDPESSSASESSSFNKKTEQENLESEEELNIMDNCLNKIGERCKEILLLWASGYKYKEISERLYIPMGTTMTYISRCRKKLKECIQNTQLLGENNEI